MHSLEDSPEVDSMQQERDETKLYVDGRYISAPEAFSRLMGWDTHRVRPIVGTNPF